MQVSSFTVLSSPQDLKGTPVGLHFSNSVINLLLISFARQSALKSQKLIRAHPAEDRPMWPVNALYAFNAVTWSPLSSANSWIRLNASSCFDLFLGERNIRWTDIRAITDSISSEHPISREASKALEEHGPHEKKAIWLPTWVKPQSSFNAPRTKRSSKARAKDFAGGGEGKEKLPNSPTPIEIIFKTTHVKSERCTAGVVFAFNASNDSLVHNRKQTPPDPVRPARPRRCSADAFDTGMVAFVSRPVLELKWGKRMNILSTT